jgi:uncharacterized protein
MPGLYGYWPNDSLKMNARPVRNSLLPTGGNVDSVIKAIINILVSTKFITLFSILFGAGFYLQLSKAAQGGVSFRSYFARRMLLLLCIGLLHGYLLWFGDIIRYYTVCGLLLLLFYRLHLKKLLIWAIVFLVPLTGLAFIFKESLGQYPYNPGIVRQLFFTPGYRSYLAINFTVDPIRNFIYDSPLTLISCFGKVLLGYWLAAKGFFSNPKKAISMSRKWIWWGSSIGIAASVGYWAVTNGKLELSPALLWMVFAIAGGLALHSLMYLAVFVRLFQSKRQKVLLLFAPVGKMALTNYLMQTVLCMFIFYNWTGGLKLYGRIGTAETYLLAIAIFTLQVIYSNWWVRRFRQGPVEYCWKKLAYRLARETAFVHNGAKEHAAPTGIPIST